MSASTISGLPYLIDVEKYRHYLAGYQISEEEKTELIKSLWTMLEGFVDQAFGRHPIQHCGMTSMKLIELP